MNFYTPYYPVNQSDAKRNREAFEAALADLAQTDPPTYYTVSSMIYGLAQVLSQSRGMGKDAALSQATEFVGACVWGKATGGRS